MPLAKRRRRLLLDPVPSTYLIRDEFTSERAAGSVHRTLAEPGPGERFVVDTGSYVTLAGGKLAISGGGSTWGTSVMVYAAGKRTPGKLMVAEITLANKLFAVVGWTNNSTGLGSSTQNIQFYFRDVLRFWGGDIGYNYGAYDTATSYKVALVQRAVGGFLFIRNYTGSYWTLLEIMRAGTADGNPQINSFNAQLTSDYLRVPSALWLPAPLASDGFSAWGTSDGKGHPEGVTGGLGSGGAGLAWTQQVGAWSVAGGAATATLSGGRAIATVDVGKADVIVMAKLTGGANSAAVLARYSTESDYVELRHTGTNVQLVKVVATVNTTLINSAVTFVAGAELRLTCEGQKFRAYYNNALIGTEQTIADASLAAGTLVGLRSANASNSFDDFVVRARGSGGEYAVLDTF